MNDTLTNAALKLRVDHLQHQIDSLKNAQVLDQVKYRAIEHQEVVNQVNEFYDSAWTKLLFLIAVIGVIVPFIIQWMQNRNFQFQQSEMIKNVSELFYRELDKFKEDNKKSIEALDVDFNKKFQDLIEENKHELGDLEANIYLTNANLFRRQKANDVAAAYYLFAAYTRDKYKRETLALKNLQVFLSLYKNLNENELKNLDNLIKSSKMKDNINEFIEHFKGTEFKDVYSDIIKEIENARINPLS